jgi:hypothetical protein
MLAPHVVACRACGALILWAEVFHDPKPVPLTSTRATLGCSSCCGMTATRSIFLTDELIRWETLRLHGVRQVAETEARRFRDHRTTRAHRFPLYSVQGAIRRELPNDFRERREHLRRLRFSLEQGFGGFGEPV